MKPSTRSASRASNLSSAASTTARARTTPTQDTYERLQPDALAQAATVEAIFVYNTAQRDQMLPRKPVPHPELDEQKKAPLKNVMPGAEAAAEETKKPGI